MSGDERTQTWFLAQVKPNQVNIAVRNLHRQGIVTFVPEDQETQRRKGRFVHAARPVFPGYVFVALVPATGLWRSVNSTIGITRLVSFGSRPAPVPDGLIGALRQRYERDGAQAAADPLGRGDTVRVTAGPFAGLLAEVEKLSPDRRVWVLMDYLGKQTRVAADIGDLRRA